MTKKVVKVWVAVNKNGYIGMYANECPNRNTEIGKWTSKYPFVNSIFYEQILDMIKKVELTWESEPEYFELTYGDTND